MNVTIIGVLVALAVANTAATIWVSKTTLLLRPQKLAQTCVIWLVPFFGAIGIVVFLSSLRERAKSNQHHIPIDSDYPGINLD